MKRNSFNFFCAFLAGFFWACGAVQGQTLPVGLWTTYDDAGKKAQSVIRISEQGGHLVGHIVEILDPEADPHPTCDRCPPDRRGLPLKGLQIISGVDVQPQGQVWRKGVILDPEEGREYRLELEWAAGAQELKVRGYWGPFWRTQTWRRVSVLRTHSTLPMRLMAAEMRWASLSKKA